MAPKPLPSRKLVQQLLSYDHESGELTWLPRPDGLPVWNGRHAGKSAGTLADGYLMVMVAGTYHRAHRLVWLYVHGEPVPDIIDHVDRNGLNNRIANLRAATGTLNLANAGMWQSNTSGFRGVHRRKGDRFVARIRYNGKQSYLGIFTTAEEAARVYQEAAVRLYGEFATWD